MRVAHVLRKYNPAEWGGTETAVQRLLDGLRAHQVESIIYCPLGKTGDGSDPLTAAGHKVERFRACLPVWRIGEEQRRQLIAVGGNLLSLSLLWKLLAARRLSIIHTHVLNRLGGAAATIARLRHIPLVVTIHGGVLDLPAAAREQLAAPLKGGLEWGKPFGWFLGARRVLERADAVLTCNRTEAMLLKQKYPDKIVMAQPHGVVARQYQEDHRAAVTEAFPELNGKQVLLVVGRIDPVKNQGWIVSQFPRVLERHPKLHLVLAGACTDEAYGKSIKKEIRNLALEPFVTLTGGLPSSSPQLIGLFQSAGAVMLPSLSETFGLVILEAWAAGTPVLASRTSGALDLIREGENGWLFDSTDPATFHNCLDALLQDPDRAQAMAKAGQGRVEAEFDCQVLAKRIKHLYEELIDV